MVNLEKLNKTARKQAMSLYLTTKKLLKENTTENKKSFLRDMNITNMFIEILEQPISAYEYRVDKNSVLIREEGMERGIKVEHKYYPEAEEWIYPVYKIEETKEVLIKYL